jgi:hypothetical protein
MPTGLNNLTHTKEKSSSQTRCVPGGMSNKKTSHSQFSSLERIHSSDPLSSHILKLEDNGHQMKQPGIMFLLIHANPIVQLLVSEALLVRDECARKRNSPPLANLGQALARNIRRNKL